MSRFSSVEQFISFLQHKDPDQQEFLQAADEVFTSLWPFLQRNPRYMEQELLTRITEPERIIQFRVTWLDDKGQVQVNRAWRIQFNSSIGPYKGGMRFHPAVNLSILKFLGFEQTLKNALTTLPMGGGKGGSDFNPKGKSDNEVMRFCQSLITELYHHLGANTDVPAGDVGVGGREIGYMVGMMKKLTNDNACIFTGKGLSYGGSLVRPQAAGYGLVYFVQAMLEKQGKSIDGMRVSVSGAGNVAQFAIEKALQMGAKVVTASDSGGMIVDEEGFTQEKLYRLLDIINVQHKRLSDYAQEMGLTYHNGMKPWYVPVDIALPCAIQNELNFEDAKELIKNKVQIVAEGANMPATREATNALVDAGVQFAPGKAANAGGVTVSGLEMAQNAMRICWSEKKVDRELSRIMLAVHDACVEYGEHKGKINYIDGANIASFIKVADAMFAQGII